MDEQLLIRFLHKKCTRKELQLIEEWIAESPDNANWLFEMEQVWSLKEEIRFSNKEEISNAYNRFIAAHPEAQHRRLKSKNILLRIGYAAAILIIVVLAMNVHKLNKQAETIAQSINVIEVPKGQRTTLILSDGTKVWLNAESRLTYPASFTAKNRLVKLQGEGFFEVEHDDHIPFIVQTADVNVTVLGTKFNVEAYENEVSYITLAEGRVEVATLDNENKVILEPRDQVSYSKVEGLNLIRGINTEYLKAWTIGELSYVNKPLLYITKDLERRFDTHITILDKELESEPFYCRVKETTKIEQVLNLLRDTRKLDYRKTEDRYEIYKYKN